MKLNDICKAAEYFILGKEQCLWDLNSWKRNIEIIF